MAVVVFGSINMDLVVRTPRLPAPGESLPGREFYTAPGGKGANQAVAAARLNAPTRLVARVGGDSFGPVLCQNLTNAGVDISAVLTDAETSSGVALIAVDDTAQNAIIFVHGANGRVNRSDVERLEAVLAGAKVLLLQLEVPMEASLAAARLARRQGLTVILDPAPARELPPEFYQLVDIITPNEVEAGQLAGFPVKTAQEANRAAHILLERGVKTAVIKLGAQGVAYAGQTGSGQVAEDFVPAFKVSAVDTVAAGDAFNGGLAVALVEGKPLPVAIQWGAAAGALSATKPGAQPSMPGRAEFEAFLKERLG